MRITAVSPLTEVRHLLIEVKTGKGLGVKLNRKSVERYRAGETIRIGSDGRAHDE